MFIPVLYLHFIPLRVNLAMHLFSNQLHFPVFLVTWEFHKFATKLKYSYSIVNKSNGYEICQTFLLYVFVCIFGLDRAQATIDFEMYWSNWPVETFLLRYSTVVCSVNKGLCRVAALPT